MWWVSLNVEKTSSCLEGGVNSTRVAKKSAPSTAAEKSSTWHVPLPTKHHTHSLQIKVRYSKTHTQLLKFAGVGYRFYDAAVAQRVLKRMSKKKITVWTTVLSPRSSVSNVGRFRI